MSNKTLAPMGKRAEHGMQQAAEHAERVDHRWKQAAFECIDLFLRLQHPSGFLAQDVEEWAVRQQFIGYPPDRRAWGAVMKRAQREGLVRADGFRRDKWGSVKTVWRGVAR